jgi:uncharacterized protein YecE (DUF72 family)
MDEKHIVGLIDILTQINSTLSLINKNFESFLQTQKPEFKVQAFIKGMEKFKNMMNPFSGQFGASFEAGSNLDDLNELFKKLQEDQEEDPPKD